MNKTAVIYSHDEVMAMPLKERPLNYRLPSTIYIAVWEAIGAASLCWNPKPTNEVFDTEQASKFAVELCFKIANEIEDNFTPKV